MERDLDESGAERGFSGPLPIRGVPRQEWPAFSDNLATAVEASGLPFIAGQNAGSRDPACFSIAINNEGDRRVSSAIAYLDAATRQRSNLSIYSQTRARRPSLDGRKITGVEIARSGGISALSAAT